MTSFRRAVPLAALTIPIWLWTSLGSATPAGTPTGACPDQLYDLGDHGMPITTASSEAQAYFDQGLVWAYSFHHKAAERSFRKAAALDPSCAMCFWGVAWSLGPNINAPMSADDAAPAYQAVLAARAALDDETERERAYVDAIATRYAAEPPTDRTPLDQAFADAMRALSHRFPADLDAATIFAEALMDRAPWSYWTAGGDPQGATPEIVTTLERVLATDPTHPGANHYYVHVMEAHYPQRAETAADRLASLVPDAGHMVHMPSHIYLRVGRYHDAALANQRAIDADRRYRERCPTSAGIYTMMYVPHNYDFLVAAAGFEGRSKLALQAADTMAAMMAPHLAHAPTMIDLQQFWMSRALVLTRFGHWQEILALPEPDDKLLYAKGLWRYARTIALIRTGDLAAAAAELAALEIISNKPSLGAAMVMGLNSATTVLKIGVFEAHGELLAAQGDLDAAVKALEQAVHRQDTLVYIEPPSWYHSVRLTLGTILLAAERPADAERVFKEDLVTFPDNVWALRGLELSLRRQSRFTDADDVARRLATAALHADIDIDAARL